MELNLNHRWMLTDEQAVNGQPELVEIEIWEAYRPGDLIKLNPEGEAVPAYVLVRKLTEDATFSKDELEFIDKFIT